jgi:hypothetical protein
LTAVRASHHGSSAEAERKWKVKNLPGEIEISCFYLKHLGPRMEGAGLRVQFHYNQKPGIHFKVPQPCEEYHRAILNGIKKGMATRFPDFPTTGSIWVTEIFDDKINSSEVAFYKAGRLVIEQAYSLNNIFTQ